ncbi:hypothetical protein CJ030_MR7G000809 [Morella rubra]|uniref:Uncharacterized protein n=1 Tax=Morella rubra TaxID=262757 RepID=A0A6A1V6J2_9ROSI|nr:hypothetical protein CJ030_MR7G000809 [Morella rubra]
MLSLADHARPLCSEPKVKCSASNDQLVGSTPPLQQPSVLIHRGRSLQPQTVSVLPRTLLDAKLKAEAALLATQLMKEKISRIGSNICTRL